MYMYFIIYYIILYIHKYTYIYISLYVCIYTHLSLDPHRVFTLEEKASSNTFQIVKAFVKFSETIRSIQILNLMFSVILEL